VEAGLSTPYFNQRVRRRKRDAKTAEDPGWRWKIGNATHAESKRRKKFTACRAAVAAEGPENVLLKEVRLEAMGSWLLWWDWFRSLQEHQTTLLTWLVMAAKRSRITGRLSLVDGCEFTKGLVRSFSRFQALIFQAKSQRSGNDA
jgi:hypothetical protein